MRTHHHPEEHPKQHPPNRIPNHHLSCMSPCTLPSRCKHAPAPSMAPEPQYRKKCARTVTSTSNSSPQTAAHSTISSSTPNCMPPGSYRQDAKMRVRAVTPQNSTCTSTPNCMPPSTLPSTLKRCTRTAVSTSNSTSNSTPISTYASTPNRTPPRSSPSISQITFPL